MTHLTAPRIAHSHLPVSKAICMVLCLAIAFAASAKTEFEKEWKRPVKEVPVWIKAAAYKSDVPQGFAEFCIADVDKTSEHVANLSLSGTVNIGSAKENKTYTIYLTDAILKFIDKNHSKLEYNGSLTLDFGYDKDSKTSHVKVLLTDGNLTVNDIAYLPIDENTVAPDDNIIAFDIEYNPQSKLASKPVPPFAADYNDLYVSRKVLVDDNTMNATEMQDILHKWEGSTSPTEKEEKYYNCLRAVSASGTGFTDFRNTRKWIIIKESPASQFSGASISHFKDASHGKPFTKYISTEEMYIPEATIAAGYHVKLNGDTIEVAKDGITAKFVGDELFSASWPALQAQYQSGNIKRKDNSILTGLAGWPSAKTPGYLLLKLDAASLLADTDQYDLRMIPGNSMTAFAYISPLNEYEPLLDGGNIIKAKKDEVDREHRRSQIDQFLSRPMGIDRKMLALNGLVSSYTESLSTSDGTPVAYTFSEDGAFDGAVPFLTFSMIVPWSKFPTGSGTTMVTEGTSKVKITVKRDTEGRLTEISTSVIGADRGKDYTTTNTFEYQDGRLSEWTQTEMAVKKVTSYIYGSDGRLQSTTTKTKPAKATDFTEKVIIKYTYNKSDSYGNWLERTAQAYVTAITIAEGSGTISDSDTGGESAERWVETRTYKYHTPNEDDIIRLMEDEGYGGI